MTVQEYKRILSENGYTYSVRGDAVAISPKGSPPWIRAMTKKMMGQLKAAAAPALVTKGSRDATAASEDGHRAMLGDKDAKKENILQHYNKVINDFMLKPRGKTGTMGEIANMVGSALYPTSVTGKALLAAPFALPEEAGLGAAAGVGAGVGALAGGASGEGALSGAGQGAFALGGGAAWEKAAHPIDKLLGYISKGKPIQELYEKSLNDVVAGIIGKDTNTGKAILGGKNWVKFLRGKAAQDDAGAALDGARQSIRDEMEAAYDEEKNSSLQHLNERWAPANAPADESSIKQMIEEKRQADDRLAGLHKLIEDYDSTMYHMRNANASGFKGGKPIESKSGQLARDSYNKLKGKARGILSKFDAVRNPDNKLVNWYDSANDRYSKFAGLRDLANKDILTEGRGHVDPIKLSNELIKNPKNLQQRLGTDYDTLATAAGRKADLMASGINIDSPGMLGRIRAMGHGVKSMFFSVPAETVTGEGPFFKHYMGSELAKATPPAERDAVQRLLVQPTVSHPNYRTAGSLLLNQAVDTARTPSSNEEPNP